MRCPRCHTRNDGASWYCRSCGDPLVDLNVADSVGPRPLPAVVRASLWFSGGLLVLVAVAAVVLARRAGRPGEDIGSAATPAAVAVPAGLTGTAPPEAARAPATIEAPPAAPATEAPDADPTEGPIAAPTVRVRPGAPTWRIGRVAAPPTLDGALDDWRGAPIDVTAVVFGDEFWDGPADLSARAFGAWDDRALYFGVTVDDDVFSAPARGRELYLGDSLELQLDVDLAGDWDTDRYDADDWQVGLSPGNFVDRGPEAFAWRPEERIAADVGLAARLRDGGYILEVALPWALVGVEPGRVTAVGLALNVSDNDLPEPAQMTMISTSPIRSWADPRSFGTLVLEPGP